MSEKSEAKIRDLIFALDDRPLVPVEVPEWGRTLYVRALSSEDRDLLEAATSEIVAEHKKLKRLAEEHGDEEFPALSQADILPGQRARICALATCDAEGKAIFEWSDIDRLRKKNGRAVERLVDAAIAASSLTPAALEELAGN